MRGEKEEKKEQVKSYTYKRCKSCGIRLNTFAYDCWKCGQRTENILYRSEKPEDALYDTPMNKIEKCIKCFNVLNLNKICKSIYCFGIGRGSCQECKQQEETRYECCQEVQKQEETVNINLIDELKKLSQSKSDKSVNQQQYKDEIPF